MKYLMMLLTILLAIVGCAQTVVYREQPEFSRLATVTDMSTVALYSDHIYCAGVWISPSLILTAGHCVYHGTIPSSTIKDWNPVGVDTSYVTYESQTEPKVATVISYDPDHDLGLLLAKKSASHPWTIISSTPNPKQGDRVFTIGHPAGLSWSFSSGDISSVRTMQGVATESSSLFIQTTAYTWFGNSGGALWDSEGRLIGIASFINTGSRHGFFVHISHILRFIGPYL